MSLLLGVDIGTSSAKRSADHSGRRGGRHGGARARVSRPHPGRAEHDARDVWWEGFATVTRELLPQAGDTPVAAVGVSGIGPCALTGAAYEELIEEARAAGHGAGGLVMLPYFAGERTPLFDPDARGLVLGLTLQHGRGHLYRAALEGTAFGVRHNLEAMRSAGGEARRLVAVGGGTKGGLWTQIVSDVLGREQVMPTVTIGACYGDALLAARAIGLSDGAGWNPPASIVEPDPAAGEIYDALYAVYRDLYPATRDAAHALAALSHEPG